jgi:hypothetical protein
MKSDVFNLASLYTLWIVEDGLVVEKPDGRNRQQRKIQIDQIDDIKLPS